MNHAMKITPDTHLSDLLADYPFLKEQLPRINSKFKLLHTPLGKLMMSQATIFEMSKRSGMNLGALIRAIEEHISQGGRA